MNVCKINIALSDQPLYITINDPQMSLDSVFTEAVQTLKDSGRHHESQQLAQLYQDHQIISNGKTMSKGSLFKDLDVQTKVVNNITVNFAEIELIKQHVGGMTKYYNIMVEGQPELPKRPENYFVFSGLSDLESKIINELHDYKFEDNFSYFNLSDSKIDFKFYISKNNVIKKVIVKISEYESYAVTSDECVSYIIMHKDDYKKLIEEIKKQIGEI